MKMRHFNLGQWADFARDLVGEEQKAAMQNHLDDGCKDCGNVLSMWRRVHEIGQRSADYEPPTVVVKSIKGMYVIHGAVKPKKVALAQLLFDSFASPQPAGIRSAGLAIRQLLYGTDGYRIDLRIEPQENSEKMVLIGQILNSLDPREIISAAPVTIVKGQRVRAFAMTNEFGEFHVECEAERGLQLRVKLQEETVSLPVLNFPKHKETKGFVDSSSGSPSRHLRKHPGKRN